MSVTAPDVIMCHGFPGSGKSTYIKTHYNKGYKEATIISNDLSKNALEDFEKALQENILIVIDNTNITKAARKKYLEIA